MIRPGLVFAAASAVVGAVACSPTINVRVEPISIYAKLDADIRVRLDQEVQDAIARNPNLF